MSQAEELLNSIPDESVSTFTVDPATEEHIVIDANRIITVPQSLRKIAVQYDHNIETVTFDCPRYWDGHDLSTMKTYINYMPPSGVPDCYPAKNVTIDDADDTIMHFEWTISRNVTQVKGTLKFLVCIKKVDDEGNESNHWNSELNREMSISEGLECEETILEQYPDVITEILVRLDNMESLQPGNVTTVITRLDTIESRLDEMGADISMVIATIPTGDAWSWDPYVGQYILDIPVAGLLLNNSAVVIPDTPIDSEAFVKAEVTVDAVRLYFNATPTSEFKCAIIYTDGDGSAVVTNVIDSATGATEEQLAQIQKNADDIAALPIEVTEDGYTDITGLRQITGMTVVKEDSTITITTTLEGDRTSESVITLDENDRPVTIVTDGVECAVTWTGFDAV